MKKLTAPMLLAFTALFLTACEDSGNPGDDNILTGATGLVILIVVIVLVGAWLFNRRH
jgi:hypothetical protein